MDKIKVVFVHYQLVCGGAEQALFDLVTLMDKEKFDGENMFRDFERRHCVMNYVRSTLRENCQ